MQGRKDAPDPHIQREEKDPRASESMRQALLRSQGFVKDHEQENGSKFPYCR